MKKSRILILFEFFSFVNRYLNRLKNIVKSSSTISVHIGQLLVLLLFIGVPLLGIRLILILLLTKKKSIKFGKMACFRRKLG